MTPNTSKYLDNFHGIFSKSHGRRISLWPGNTSPIKILSCNINAQPRTKLSLVSFIRYFEARNLTNGK